MSVPYTRTLEATATSGQANIIPLPVPSRGFLHRLVVKQADGSADGWSHDVYDRLEACPNENPDSECADENQPLLNPAVHKIMATVTVNAASTTSEQFNLEIPYNNQDHLGCDGPPGHYLYLVLTPSGSGDKTFHIGLTASNDT